MPLAQEVKFFDINEIEVVAGQHLKIETTPTGEDVLDEECPEGETWEVRVQVRIEISET